MPRRGAGLPWPSLLRPPRPLRSLARCSVPHTCFRCWMSWVSGPQATFIGHWHQRGHHAHPRSSSIPTGFPAATCSRNIVAYDSVRRSTTWSRFGTRAAPKKRRRRSRTSSPLQPRRRGPRTPQRLRDTFPVPASYIHPYGHKKGRIRPSPKRERRTPAGRCAARRPAARRCRYPRSCHQESTSPLASFRLRQPTAADRVGGGRRPSRLKTSQSVPPGDT